MKPRPVLTGVNVNSSGERVSEEYTQQESTPQPSGFVDQCSMPDLGKERGQRALPQNSLGVAWKWLSYTHDAINAWIETCGMLPETHRENAKLVAGVLHQHQFNQARSNACSHSFAGSSR